MSEEPGGRCFKYRLDWNLWLSRRRTGDVRKYTLYLFFSALFSLIAELLHAGYTKCLVSGSIAPAASLSFILPLVGFFGSVYFVDEKCNKKRFGLVAASAFGFALGTIVVMLVW